MMKRFLPAVVGLFLVLLWGCAPQYVPPDYSSYVTPKPPQRPRIRLLNIIYTDLDIRGAGAAETLFGEQASFAFVKPHNIAVDDNGNMYVTDTYRRRVSILNTETKTIEELFNPAGWRLPAAVDVDIKNRLLAVSNDNVVQLFNLDSKRFTLMVGKDDDMVRVGGVAFDPARKIIYVSDTKKSAVYAYDYAGKRVATVATEGYDEGEVYFPTGLDVDSVGRLYVVDTMNFRVQVYNPDGSYYGMFGKHGDTPGSFARPKSLSVNRDDLVLVLDAATSFFQIFDKDGNVYIFAGGRGDKPGQFRSPSGIFVDENDKVYVVDQVNRRLEIFQLYTDRYYNEHPEEAAKYLEPKSPSMVEKEAEPEAVQEEAPEKASSAQLGTPDETGKTSGEETPTEEELDRLGW